MEAAKSPFDETMELVRNTTGVSVCKRQTEELVWCAAPDFDDFYKAPRYYPARPESNSRISVGGQCRRQRHRNVHPGSEDAFERVPEDLISRQRGTLVTTNLNVEDAVPGIDNNPLPRQLQLRVIE